MPHEKLMLPNVSGGFVKAHRTPRGVKVAEQVLAGYVSKWRKIAARRLRGATPMLVNPHCNVRLTEPVRQGMYVS